MPAKNIIKPYLENGYYHIYNRGVEKRTIYTDEKDHAIFLGYLKSYLSPPPKLVDIKQPFTLQGYSFQGVPHQRKNYHQEIELLAYCLMPNHFHLLIWQKSPHGIDHFMRSLGTRYVINFNKRHNRVGALFQNTYKAVLVKEEAYLLHLSRYIHRNPTELGMKLTQAHSSYPEYLGLRNTTWVKPELILSFFNQATLPILKQINTYQQFVESIEQDSIEFLGDIAIDHQE